MELLVAPRTCRLAAFGRGTAELAAWSVPVGGPQVMTGRALHGPPATPHFAAHVSSALTHACAFCPQLGFQHASSHGWS